MKRLLAFLLAVMFLVALTACGTPPAELESSDDVTDEVSDAVGTDDVSDRTTTMPSSDADAATDTTTSSTTTQADTNTEAADKMNNPSDASTTTTVTTPSTTQAVTTTKATTTQTNANSTTATPTTQTPPASTTGATTSISVSVSRTEITAASSTGGTNADGSDAAKHPHAHQWIKTTKVPATCTEQGYTLVEYSCGSSEKKELTPALGHSMTNWVTTKAPTNSAAGESKALCTRCPYEETKAIPKLPSSGNATAMRVLELVNIERAKAGLSPLSYYVAEQAAADQRTYDIEKDFSHYRPNGEPFHKLLVGLGTDYFGCGENVAKGFDDPETVVKAWMDSPDHRANILDPDFEALTVGIRDGFWVQLFIDLIDPQ